MHDTFFSLYRHHAWADAKLLAVIQEHPAAREDKALVQLVQHILLVQAFFVSRLKSEPFDAQRFTNLPDSLADLVPMFREVHAAQLQILDSVDLSARIEIPQLPGGSRSAHDVLLQVVMHSLGHRAQALKLLRELGGAAPPLDYILWISERAEPQYPG